MGSKGWYGRVRIVCCAVPLLASSALASPLGAEQLASPLGAEQADALRIQQHLASVEQRLRAAPVLELPAAARAMRARLLDELHAYWRAGVFPRNSGHVGERRPYFIDDDGRPCAVGALIQRSGHEALAARIDRQYHTDYVPEMPDAELAAWAKLAGFTVAELALIQPTYCNCDGWNGAFGPEGAGGAGGAPNGADYFQPVCASNGLTYWNECIAELCGDVTIVAQGSCEPEPRCELCGTGARDVVVAECTLEGTGICNGIDSQPNLVPMGDINARRWRELQQGGCTDTSYAADDWQPSNYFDEQWQCGSEPGAGGAGGAPATTGGAAGAASDPPAAGGDPGEPLPGSAGSNQQTADDSSGCSCRTTSDRGPSAPAFALLLAGALAWLRRRPSR